MILDDHLGLDGVWTGCPDGMGAERRTPALSLSEFCDGREAPGGKDDRDETA
jgi:hypothetical protein